MLNEKHSKVKHNKWGTVGGGICPFTIPGMFVICLGSMKAVKLSTKQFWMMKKWKRKYFMYMFYAMSWNE